MPKRKYKIAVVQLNLNDVAENNLKKCISWVRDAAGKGAEVILLPELYSSHYFCQSEDVDNFALAEPLYSTSFIAFSELAKELGVVIIVPFFEKRMAGIYHNSAYIIDTDGTEAGLYRKMHIPDDPHFYEKFYFTPGDLGFQAIETKKGTDHTFQLVESFFKSLSEEEHKLIINDFIEMLVFDAIIGNRDRHQQNWAIIREIKVQTRTGKYFSLKKQTNLPIITRTVRFSPLFDNGNCLAYNIIEEKLHNFIDDEEKLEIENDINSLLIRKNECAKILGMK